MNEETPPQSPFTIRLFGPLQLTRGGSALPRPRNRRAVWLLALLALRDGEVSREWLAATLWPESLPAQAAYNLRRNLSELRIALGEDACRIYAPTPQTLRLNTANAYLDSHEFAKRLKRGTPADLEAALACYTGDLLEGCGLDWIAAKRRQLRESYLETLEKLAAHYTETNDLARAISLLRQTIARVPARETAQCRLMESLAAQGNFAEVTQVYRAFRLYLHTEMQSAPRPETNALYTSLKSNTTTKQTSANVSCATPDTRHPTPFLPAFPNPLTPLIGREKEIEEVRICLQNFRLVTLKGPGGCGKTRLAIALGQGLREQFAGQVWFVSLAELPDADRLPETVGAALNLPIDTSDPFGQVVSRLAARPALLILDNYEHLIATGTRFVGELLASAPLLRCLVTSRHSLHLTGEMEYYAPPLALPDKADSVSRLLEFSGVQLFMERAAARRATFLLTPENADTIAALCAKLEGIPLAIELVAAWSNLLTPAQMLTRLENNFAFPGSQHSEMPTRHRSLQTEFDGSYALLDDAERLLLRRLSVFAGGWTLEAAEAICVEEGKREEGRGKREEGNTADGNLTENPKSKIQNPKLFLPGLLKSLVEKSLVLFREAGADGGGPSRYQLLEMTRQYVQEHLSDSEREAIERRHANYYFQDAQDSEAQIYHNETGGAQQRRMMPDRENYIAACQRWQTLDADKALEMLMFLDAYGIWTITRSEQNEWIARLETQPLPAPSPLQAKFYFHVAGGAICRTIPIWVALMEKAVLLAEGCGDKARIANALSLLAEEDIRAGNRARARERLQTVLDCAMTLGNPLLTANAQYHLIRIACAENDFQRARQMGEALLQSGKARSHWPTTTRALDALSAIAIGQGEMSRGRDCMEQQLAAYPETEGLPRSNTLRALGKLASQQGDYAAARDYLARSQVLCQASGDMAHEAWTYHGLSDVAHRQGNDAEALQWEQQALGLFDLCGQIGSMTTCLFTMARLCANQPEQAAFLWAVSERLARENHCPIRADYQAEINAARVVLQITLPESLYAAVQQRAAAQNLREVARCACA